MKACIALRCFFTFTSLTKKNRKSAVDTRTCNSSRVLNWLRSEHVRQIAVS